MTCNFSFYKGSEEKNFLQVNNLRSQDTDFSFATVDAGKCIIKIVCETGNATNQTS